MISQNVDAMKTNWYLQKCSSKERYHLDTPCQRHVQPSQCSQRQNEYVYIDDDRCNSDRNAAGDSSSRRVVDCNIIPHLARMRSIVIRQNQGRREIRQECHEYAHVRGDLQTSDGAEYLDVEVKDGRLGKEQSRPRHKFDHEVQLRIRVSSLSSDGADCEVELTLIHSFPRWHRGVSQICR
jgi:hypothetical protein